MGNSVMKIIADPLFDISVFQFYAVYMKIEVRRRDSLPTVTGRIKTRSSSSQHRSVAVQTVLNGQEWVGIKDTSLKDFVDCTFSCNMHFLSG